MKRIDSEDPRVTAYALGELPEHEAAELRRVAEEHPAVQAALDETRAIAGLIRGGFGRKVENRPDSEISASQVGQKSPYKGDLHYSPNRKPAQNTRKTPNKSRLTPHQYWVIWSVFGLEVENRDFRL